MAFTTSILLQTPDRSRNSIIRNSVPGYKEQCAEKTLEHTLLAGTMNAASPEIAFISYQASFTSSPFFEVYNIHW